MNVTAFNSILGGVFSINVDVDIGVLKLVIYRIW